MRVAMIGHKQFPSRSGGVEVVVEELSTRLSQLGYSVTVYNRKKRGESSPKSFRGVEIIDIPTPDNKSFNALVYSYLATLHAVFHGVDVIHYHALGPAASLWLAKLFGKRVVVTVHGLNYKTPKWKGFGARYIKFGERVTARHADSVVVLSKAIQRYFKETYDCDCEYLPNGLSMPESVESESILSRFSLQNKEYALCVSRLVPGKGLETLIQAFKRVETSVKLVIAGDSEHVDNFKRSLKDAAIDDDRIVFTGFLNKDALCALYSHAKLFVFPSEAEGMPMCLLEAMWFNCPCLVSDIPENTEVLHGNGYVFKVGDVVDLQIQMQKLLFNAPDTIDLRSMVRKNHDWDVVADKTAQLYRRVCAL